MFPTTHRSLLRGIPLTVAVLTAGMLAGCGPQPEVGSLSSRPAGTPSSEQTAAPERATDKGAPDGTSAAYVLDMPFTDCEAERYTVGYPADWNSNPGDGLLGPCEIFHPGDIEAPQVPRDGDLHYSVSMYVDDVDFGDHAVGENLNEVIDERETTVEGRRAQVTEYRSTGHSLVPSGEYSYSWVVDLDGQLLVATTSSVGDTDYERDKRIIDRMLGEELRLHDRDPAHDRTTMVEGPATTDTSSEEPHGWPLVVTDVRVGAHTSFDRLVFEIGGDGDAGWLIEYEDAPRSQGSGHPVEIDGDAVLRVSLQGMAYDDDAPEESYNGPDRITPTGSDAIVEVVEDTLYEGHHDFFVGLDQERPYRIQRLSDPQRIVIDIEATETG